jgi:dihydropyrimidinase
MFDLVIRGGTVVTASETTICDLGVRDGRVAAIAEHIQASGKEIDARGRLVMPGGVDAHCHVAQKSSSGLMTADDFYTAGLSAACGGTTTIIPFAVQYRGQSLRTVVAEYHEQAEGKAFVDYAFHLIVSDLSGDILPDELPDLVRDGYASFKVFMTYDALRLADRQLLDVFALARREGALVMVHAENHDAISWLTEQLVLEHRTAPRFHAASRPPVVEAEAVHRAIALAELAEVPIVIVHVTSNDAVQEICAARARGAHVFAETCPQYLLLTSDDLDRPGFEGAKYVCSPPLRDRFDQDALWQALADGVFDIVSSDHAGYRFDDPTGKKAHGDRAPFTKIPNGMPGLETRLPLLFSEGVGRGRLSPNAFVTLTATNPARLFGLHPRKGAIAIGSDADIAIWDPDLEVTIAGDRMHDAMDYTAYEGMKVRGWPVTTISRGEIIWADGEVRGRQGRGRFLEREPGLPGIPLPTRQRVAGV